MEFGNEKAVFILCAMILNIFLKVMQFIKLGEHGGGHFSMFLLLSTVI